MESLYRTYRPQTFADMVGQKHIVSTLRNALVENRVAHAYLFCGPRGTGKTTTARVLAKALLCTGAGSADGPTPEPDGTCEECQAIASGTHPDVYELDAASRTGVDNVREEIINRVAFAPTRGRYKVYIIDEVHMLTTQAFNALLKTLEEPPAHVIFILCTTDPQKVPETILSRCQRLEFHRIATDEIAERLAYVCEKEGFQADPDALALIARHSRGGLRDALSMLEQLSVFGDRSVRLEDAQTVLGEVGSEALTRMVEQICARDVAGCFEQVADLADRGVDIAQYVRDLTSYVRDLYVASVTGMREGVLSGGTDAAAAAREAEKAGGTDRLARMLDLLGELETNLRTSLDQRLSLEVTLTRIARPQSDLTIEALAERVALLERQLAGGVVPAAAPAGAGARADAGVPAGGRGAAPVAGGMPAGSAGAPAGGFAPVAGGVPADAPAAPRTTSGMPIPRPAVRPAAGASAPAGAGMSARPAAPSGAGVPVPPRPQPAVRPAAPTGGAARAAGASAAAPAAGGAAGRPSSLGAPIHDPATAQRLWGQFTDRVRSADPSIAAFINQTEGTLREGNVLALTNHGSRIVPTRLMSPKIKVVLERLASDVYGVPVQVAMDEPSAVPAAAGAASPATAVAGGAPVRAAAPVSRPAPAIPTPARPTALASGAPARPTGAPTGSMGAPARPAPTPAIPPRPAAAPAVTGAPARPTAPAPAPAPAPARPMAPSDDAPAYEPVPDEVYDAYVPDDDDLPPFDEAPANSTPAVPGGAAPASRPTPVPASAGAAASSAPAPAPDASAEGAEGEASAMDDLAKMLSAGFGGYVKISEEPSA